MLKLLLTTPLLLLLLHSLAVDGHATLLGSTPNGTSVYGVANVLGLLHVVRDNVASIQIYAPLSSQFTELRPLEVLNKTGFYDMAYLPKANRLILLNWFDGKNVTVLQMYPPYNVSKWSFTTKDTVAALSVTDGDEYVVITESVSKSIKVFTMEGVLVRQIFLMTTLSPRHAIRTVDNLYAVTFGYERKEPHYICKFNVMGFVVGVCFGGRPGNSSMQLDVPARMLNAQDGGILVADMNNQRVLKVAQNLTSAGIVLNAQMGLNQPYRLAYYDVEKVLYVADNFIDPVTKYSIGGRVLAFQYDH